MAEPIVTVVIPATDILGDKNEQDLENLLISLEVGRFPGQVIVCFDSCNEDFVEKFTREHPQVIPLVNRKNRLNFARNSNMGLRYAHKILDTDVLLVNQDCVLPHWDYLQNIRSDGLACGEVHKEKDPLELSKINEELASTRELVVTKFAFSCVFISKAVMDKVGYLDGTFIASMDDDDYISRAFLAGFRAERVNVKYYHDGDFISTEPGWTSASGSYNQELLNFNLIKYGTKYQIPPSVTHENMLAWVQQNHVWSEDFRVN